ncbi:MAG: peptidoglycan editing factor PgeF [Chloroflexi bacterium]|nr:peptidoglycan editing factor PgeF [Chloroflexota bacterium]
MTGAPDLPLLRFSLLQQATGIEHAVSTRHGGVSDGRFASLNISYTVGDDVAHVDENLSRLASAVGTRREELFAAYQVHGNAVTVVESDTEPRPQCDVLVTRSPGRTLLLRFADCTPILLVDPVQRAVGLAHAGWRGTAVRTATAAVRAMVDALGTNPRDLLAAVGPAIGPCCYTVGDDVRAAFADRPWAVRTEEQGGLVRLDLWEANRRALVEAGVPATQVEVARVCTHCNARQFFSHRANGGQPAGRFAAVLRLTA